MASPTDAARNTSSTTTAGTSHTITVGSPAAGVLLIVLIRFGAAQGTITFTGYTSIANDASDAGAATTAIYYRWADGAEGASDAMTTQNSAKMGAICWQITGALNPATKAPSISTVAIGTTSANTCDPSAVTPSGGLKDYLFIACGSLDGEPATYFTGAPTNYSNITSANSGTGGAATTNCAVGGATRQLSASSEDPGVFTHGAANAGWTAFTVAIDPATQIYQRTGVAVMK